MNRDFSDLCDDDDAELAEVVPRWRHKWQRILAAMLDGRARNAIEHGRELGTSCLHSDIAGLEARGLRFDHERITVAGYGGAETAVMRYRLRPESYGLARRLLGLAAPSGEPDDAFVREYRRASGG